MKTHLLSATLIASLAISANAGSYSAQTAADSNPFADAIAPISSPTLSDLALPRTKIHALGINQQLSDKVSVGKGATEVGVGGDLNVVALQLEYAFNKRLSLVANKDGYIDFNPEGDVLDKDSGFANIAAGLKYAFIYDEANQFVLSGSAILELPTGNRNVFQGFGDGAVNLSVYTLKLHEGWQFSTSTGVQLPFDTKEQAITGFANAHASYKLTERFTPLVEVNWLRVLSAGEGDQGHIPAAAADFEGGDLLNLGSSHASTNKDIVTAAAGARYKVGDSLSLGAAYEIPLTSEEDNLMKSRITVDAVFTF